MHLIEFRPMLATDIESVMLVEKSAYEFPWTKGIFADCLRVGYDCIVATENDQILAHAVLSTAADESHILNLTVNKNHQGKGIGKQLLRHLIDIARVKSSQVIMLEARHSNQAAIHLYQSVGFNEIGCRKAYYPAPGGKEDALVFALQL
jgi:[ribosomal protein S18]-alanine N-acetyltransferase